MSDTLSSYTRPFPPQSIYWHHGYTYIVIPTYNLVVCGGGALHSLRLAVTCVKGTPARLTTLRCHGRNQKPGGERCACSSSRLVALSTRPCVFKQSSASLETGFVRLSVWRRPPACEQYLEPWAFSGEAAPWVRPAEEWAEFPTCSAMIQGPSWDLGVPGWPSNPLSPPGVSPVWMVGSRPDSHNHIITTSSQKDGQETILLAAAMTCGHKESRGIMGSNGLGWPAPREWAYSGRHQR